MKNLPHYYPAFCKQPCLFRYAIGDKSSIKSVIEGNLVRSSERKINLVMHGQTYVAVFGTNPPITNLSNIDIITFPVGNPIVLGGQAGERYYQWRDLLARWPKISLFILILHSPKQFYYLLA